MNRNTCDFSRHNFCHFDKFHDFNHKRSLCVLTTIIFNLLTGKEICINHSKKTKAYTI